MKPLSPLWQRGFPEAHRTDYLTRYADSPVVTIVRVSNVKSSVADNRGGRIRRCRIMDENRKVYGSIIECASKLRISPNTVANAIQMNAKTRHGHLFRLTEEDYQKFLTEKGTVDA